MICASPPASPRGFRESGAPRREFRRRTPSRVPRRFGAILRCPTPSLTPSWVPPRGARRETRPWNHRRSAGDFLPESERVSRGGSALGLTVAASTVAGGGKAPRLSRNAGSPELNFALFMPPGSMRGTLAQKITLPQRRRTTARRARATIPDEADLRMSHRGCHADAATKPQMSTPVHVATLPNRSSAAVPAHGPMITDRLNVLEYAPMYSPIRPRGARSAITPCRRERDHLAERPDRHRATSGPTVFATPIAPKAMAVSACRVPARGDAASATSRG